MQGNVAPTRQDENALVDPKDYVSQKALKRAWFMQRAHNGEKFPNADEQRLIRGLWRPQGSEFEKALQRNAGDFAAAILECPPQLPAKIAIKFGKKIVANEARRVQLLERYTDDVLLKPRMVARLRGLALKSEDERISLDAMKVLAAWFGWNAATKTMIGHVDATDMMAQLMEAPHEPGDPIAVADALSQPALENHGG